MGGLRYIYFIEGAIFAGSAFLAVRWGGLGAVISCSILCSTCFSGAYALWRVSRYFQVPIREIALDWLAPMTKVLTLFIPAAVILWWAGNQLDWPPAAAPRAAQGLSQAAQVQGASGVTDLADRVERSQQTWHALTQLLFKGLLGGALGGYLFLRYGLPPAFKNELLRRSPPRINPFLRRVFA
jgi:hypothetical protein